MLKLYKGLKPYVKQLIVMILLLFVQAFSMLLLPSMMSMIIDKGVVQGDMNYIVTAGIIMICITLAGSASAIGVGYFASKVAVGFCTDTRKRLFRHIDRFTLEEFDRVGTSSLTTRSTNDILQVQNFTIMLFRVIILAPIMCIGGITLAFQKNATLAMVLVVCMPVIVVFLVLVLRSAFPIFRSMQSKLDKVNLIIRENITGVRVVRAFTAEEREEKRFEKANEDMTQASTKSQVKVSTLMPLLMLIINLGTVAVVWFGGQQISQGVIQVGDMMALIQYLMLIMYALVMMSLIFALMPRASVCAERIVEVLEIKPVITDAAQPKIPEKQTGVVEFRDVTLTYGNSETPAVSGISFTAMPGQTTAIIGATGSGKSSVICMIPRLRDPAQGTVLVDGVDVREYSLDALRKRIGYVPQKSNLFAGTIRSNIAFSNENMSDGQVKRAARIAQADDFISKKELGYDDPVAEGGTNVSGGQRQRLAIARAMATDANIFVFDDSFSALDFKTDAAVRQAIRENTQDATVIIVAQRVGTIMNADKILVMDQGKIVGEGTHEELLRTCDIYAQIAKTQLAGGGEEK
ncbi:ABC transporter ATP-binding protein [Christensenella tenuis]|uniref:ABC transporter ATP-binding protein n=1 Tax=Christensenella tenuis TaxID=2763033 RepID=A0ABR7EDY0_9FIRM|nr:ABC transporter ATP-binding protein [Christensenella tenuis]MBC5647985.1 ABC transporter ATP-binding protein [Christensenella tenuis]